MKDRIADTLASLAVVTAGIKRFQEVLYNYATAPAVFADGVVEGLVQLSPSRDTVVLDGRLVTEIENDATNRLNQIVPDVAAAMESSWKASFAAHTAKLAKEEALLKEGDVSKLVLLLPKKSAEAYVWVAKKKLIKGREAQEISVSKEVDKVGLHNSVLQSTILAGIHRAGMAVGSILSPILQRKGEVFTADGVQKSYAIYTVGRYLVDEVYKATKKSVVFPITLAAVGLAGLSDGLISDARVVRNLDQERLVESVVAESKSVTQGVIAETMQAAFDDFSTSFNAAMKKQAKHDEALKEGDMTDLIKKSPHKTKKIAAMRGRGHLLKMPGGNLVVKAADGLLSINNAAAAVVLKGVYGIMRGIGSIVNSVTNEDKSPDATPGGAIKSNKGKENGERKV